jgi:hypothetical protein
MDLPNNPDLKLNGLSMGQADVCRCAFAEFLTRHRLVHWQLEVTLSESGPETWQMDVSVAAPPEMGFPVRSNSLGVDKNVALARVIDLCLETHYNACMNRKAAGQASTSRRVVMSKRQSA